MAKIELVFTCPNCGGSVWQELGEEFDFNYKCCDCGQEVELEQMSSVKRSLKAASAGAGTEFFNKDVTVREYNTVYHRKITNAESFLGCLDHSLQKSCAYEAVMHQLQCIGWSEEMRQTMLTALRLYKETVKKQAVQNRDGTAK